MDFKDNSALYECLSMQITSESEMSNDESSLPRVKEILDAETFVKNFNRKNRSDASNNYRTRQTNRYPLRNAKIKISKEIMKRKPLKNQGKKNQSFVKDDCHSEVEDDPGDGELADSEAERNDSPSKMDEKTPINNEASEDCSSDTEPVKDLLSSQRRRTVSGSSITVHVCSFEGCGKEFNRPWRLAEHQHLHTGKRPFKCPEEGCGRTYARKQHLQRHTATAHQCKKTQEYLKCEDCNKLMKNRYTMAKHYYRAHVRKDFKCKECGQCFKKQKHFKSHSFIHTGIEPYMCEYPGCGKRFMLPSRVRTHALVHVQKCYTCPNESCGKTFDVHLDLRRHLATNHPKVCDVCGKKFRRLAQLRAHRKIHDDVREAFFCPSSKCDRYFYAERNLDKHIRDKHEGTTIYQCSICSLRLATKQKLAYHMTIHSPSYQRNYHTDNPRKPRKDKGTSRTDYARLLSGYTGDELYEDHLGSTVSGGVQPQIVSEEIKSSSDDD